MKAVAARDLEHAHAAAQGEPAHHVLAMPQVFLEKGVLPAAGPVELIVDRVTALLVDLARHERSFENAPDAALETPLRNSTPIRRREAYRPLSAPSTGVSNISAMCNARRGRGMSR